MTLLLEQAGARLEVRDMTLLASGEADFDVATALAAQGREWLDAQAAGARVRFDLTGVNRASSAALSVMLEWLRCARRGQLEVAGVCLSAPLARLTAMAGLEPLLPRLETAE
ncbi:STAS domain-containing protein [Modicisalibacter tunisiensis]|uniref:STAS domain-containing protein n=1 Tax=Modicisalibacter tunisiensis TaxID=390637 RepID=A0ABS7X1Y8_9GAMM|nr:STAS domain-containing protein [Modicisalibacter tunisiensis]MBZ9568116.1 STAS domain-containing protein [Modicisalibacter tunisiensis]